MTDNLYKQKIIEEISYQVDFLQENQFDEEAFSWSFAFISGFCDSLFKVGFITSDEFLNYIDMFLNEVDSKKEERRLKFDVNYLF